MEKPALGWPRPCISMRTRVAVAEIDVVSHPDFIAVINNRSAGKGKGGSLFSNSKMRQVIVIHERTRQQQIPRVMRILGSALSPRYM